jgi:hypothetical protein
VDGTDVGVLEQPHEIGLAGLLESHHSRALEAKVSLEVLGDRWKGILRRSSSVVFWYLLISLRATVPGLYLWGFLTPPVAGALFLAAFVASCFLGALPPVDLRAVCLVLAMLTTDEQLMASFNLSLAL